MIIYLRKILLKREAVLFDAPLFIAKSFIAILLGYALFSGNSFLGRDMISLMLGLMLTLEPVNVSGFKSGLDQITASFIGGGITALIVIIGGINFITVPLAVAATLYITLRINWRSMSVIAIFTSIYMTQYIQYTVAGEPSMFLTLQLRLLSLGTGILIAIAMNFLFSLIFYRSMIKKRTIFVIEQTISSIMDFVETAAANNDNEILQKKIIVLFGDIDYIITGLSDMKRKKTKAGRTKDFINILKELRVVNHCLLDLAMLSEDENIDQTVLFGLKEITASLDRLAEKISNKSQAEWIPDKYSGENRNLLRIQVSLLRISKLL